MEEEKKEREKLQKEKAEKDQRNWDGKYGVNFDCFYLQIGALFNAFIRVFIFSAFSNLITGGRSDEERFLPYQTAETVEGTI